MSTRPLVDGTDLREATVRDYRRNAERAGLRVDMAVIEAVALSDCNTYAAVQRDNRPRIPSAPDPEKAAEKAAALGKAIDDVAPGAELLDERPAGIPIPLLHDVPNPNDRWAWALGRLAVILRGADPLAYAGPSPSWEQVARAMTSTCECPDLAFEAERLKCHWGIYMATGCKGTLKALGEVNVFASMKVGDAAKKYRRLTEDICDKSTGRLGSWWTPK